MNENDKDKILENLARHLEEYVDATIEKYGKYMSREKLDKLKNITDFKSIIKIYDYGSINAFANDMQICMPLVVDKILNDFSKIPGYGSDKDHKTYNSDTLISNNNTFKDYIFHAFVSGTNAETFYEDMLLHETMHFCGSGGASALKEGINELLTRKIALENDFRTNACGYPKEVQIALELQNIFGEEILDQIAFINRDQKIYMFLENLLGVEEAELYINVSRTMEEEFSKKYYKGMDSYKGFEGVLKKTSNYSQIDYSSVYEIINNYKLSHQKDEIENKSK